MDIIVALLLALVGIFAGALVNALADYLPPPHPATSLRMNSTSDAPEGSQPETGNTGPGSVFHPHYPDGTLRPPLAWLGLLAFITGRRRSPAGAALSWRHPITELVLGISYALLILGWGVSLQTIFTLAFLAIFALITVIDVEHKLILLIVIVPACALALLNAILMPDTPPDLRAALIGGVAGFGLFFLMFLGGVVFSKVTGTGEVAFGFGDVMLGTLSGLLLGWQALFFALIITVFLGALGALLYLVSRLFSRSKYSMFTALPYGPYIVAGTVIMMLWREEVRALILR